MLKKMYMTLTGLAFLSLTSPLKADFVNSCCVDGDIHKCVVWGACDGSFSPWCYNTLDKCTAKMTAIPRSKVKIVSNEQFEKLRKQFPHTPKTKEEFMEMHKNLKLDSK